MALTWFQRLQVAFRGWSRRRDEAARQRDEESLRRNVTWGKLPSAAAPSASTAPASARSIDLEGLQVAYLDDSGQIAWYLDADSGDVIEARDAPTQTDIEKSPRFHRVPSRSEESDAEDRRAFIETLEPSRMRQSLSMTLDAHDFRKIVAGDRAVERAWYNFKNQRATSAIESWLHRLGLH